MCVRFVCWPQFLKFPFRYYVLFLCALSSAFMSASRCVINVAILAMVNTQAPNTFNSTGSQFELLNETSPVSMVNLNLAPTFNWNQAQQAIIIGAYFYPYTAMQISTGFLADKFDVVKFSALSHLMVTLATAAIPWAAQTHFLMLVAMRFITGFCHAPTYPCLYIIFEKWFPPQEKTLAQAIMNVGTNLGFAFIMPATAWLCDNGFAGGWPSAFYSTALANIIYVILWYTTVTADPRNSPFLSENEKKVLPPQIDRLSKRKVNVPWWSMVTSIPLWSVTIAKGVNSIAYQSINSRIPLYLKSILGYPLQGNGLINASFYIAGALGQLTCGPLSRFIVAKDYFKLTVTRKLFESIAFTVPGLFLLSIPFLSGQAEAIIFGIIIAMFTMGAVAGGDVPIVPEMAPGLVGTVFGFANTLSCVGGFLAPMTIGAILGDQDHSEARWNIVFYLFGSLQFVGLAIFTLFATSKPQSWALVETETKSSKHILSTITIADPIDKVNDQCSPL